MADKLELYNAALYEVEHRALGSLTERVEARRLLDAVYDRVVELCLSSASWNFAIETTKLTADTGVEPNFGPTEVFAKPSDWIRTFAVSYDEFFGTPALDYVDEGGNFVAGSSPLYMRYVSTDTGLGLELTRWTEKFTRYVELELATRICRRINQDKSLHDILKKERNVARREAKNQDSMDDVNPKFPPPSSWTTVRNGRSGRGDRGSKTSLIG